MSFTDTEVDTDKRVLIVGAGLGGLALAQILRKQGIPYAVFERDDQQHARQQGSAVAVVEPLAALQELLPSDLGDIEDVSVHHGFPVDDEIQIRDAITGQVLARLGGIPKGSPGHLIRADRERVRDFLWNKIPVQSGKHFHHYAEDADGITLTFRDGSVARGAVLVACDGAHSHIRTQLLGVEQSRPVVSQYAPIMGECSVSPDMHAKLTEHGNAGMLLGNVPGVRVLIGLRGINPDRSGASWFWLVMYQSENPEAETDWVYNASATELYDKVMEKTIGMYSLYTDLLKKTGPEGMVTHGYRFYEFVSPSSLPQGRVTLLGDAAHSMIPMKAAGANTALEDACDLGRLITDRSSSGDTIPWPEVLKEYEKIMLPRGAEKVLASRKAGEMTGGATELASR